MHVAKPFNQRNEVYSIYAWFYEHVCSLGLNHNHCVAKTRDFWWTVHTDISVTGEKDAANHLAHKSKN